MFRRILVPVLLALATLTSLPTGLASPTSAAPPLPAGVGRPRSAYPRFGWDTRRYPQERAIVRRLGFPYLGEQFEVLAPHTNRYNCIAWSVRVNYRWDWPAPNTRPATVRDFDAYYARYHFRPLPTGLDYRVVPGMEKVVLYGHVRPGRRIEPTHAARQLSDGTWTSKLGQAPRIRHLTPEALNGTSYGQPVKVYYRMVRGPGMVSR